MARDWEDIFSQWAKPPGQTEQERIENAVSAVRKALDDDDRLRSFTQVYVQGSYRNRVNVRQESDVDLGVLYTGDSFGVKYPPGKGHADFGNTNATYTYQAFKDDVGRALVRRFGARSVQRGNKAFDIHENSYRVDADVVPVFVHRRYDQSGWYICGVEFLPGTGERIVNWPERLYDDTHWPDQHYENGVQKNAATSRRYKGVVRIFKNVRNEMDAAGITAAKAISGFLVECLVWNVPDFFFGQSTWDEAVQGAFAYLWGNTKTDAQCSEWGEVSELKYLFRGSPATKREQAYAFIDRAWSYVGVRQT